MLSIFSLSVFLCLKSLIFNVFPLFSTGYDIDEFFLSTSKATIDSKYLTSETGKLKQVELKSFRAPDLKFNLLIKLKVKLINDNLISVNRFINSIKNQIEPRNKTARVIIFPPPNLKYYNK